MIIEQRDPLLRYVIVSKEYDDQIYKFHKLPNKIRDSEVFFRKLKKEGYKWYRDDGKIVISHLYGIIHSFNEREFNYFVVDTRIKRVWSPFVASTKGDAPAEHRGRYISSSTFSFLDNFRKNNGTIDYIKMVPAYNIALLDFKKSRGEKIEKR